MKLAGLFAFMSFIGLTLLYYFMPLPTGEALEIFLTISSFLFAIFTGFFISMQGRRYRLLKENLSDFDGELTSIYRSFGHFKDEYSKQAKTILLKHYQAILEKSQWDYHFMNKSNTLKKLHSLSKKAFSKKTFSSLQNFSVQRILVSLQNLQLIRKRIVSLHNERIPLFQITLVYFLAMILLVTVSLIPSYALIFPSLLKGAFGSATVFVIFLLRELDQLHFFEHILGENSAKDVMGILNNER